MAVQATLVALVAQIDLQSVQRLTANRRKVGGLQEGEGGVHEKGFLVKMA
jgi:hypothetical protein